MSPTSPPDVSLAKRFPRVSGDEPDPADMCADFLKFSPREWG